MSLNTVSSSPNSNSPSSSSVVIPGPLGEGSEVPPNFTPEMLAEQRCQWLSKILAENPEILTLRERILPWTGGYSFSNLVHSDSTAVLSHVNRHVILEIVFQHLHSIGMHQTAETIQKESGHEFQILDQPWDRTSLLILSSLGVLAREDPWNISTDPHHSFVEESLEEDFFSYHYREDPKSIFIELLDTSSNVIYEGTSDESFSALKAASLRRLVTLLVTSPADLFSDDKKRAFFLALHSITSSHHFFEHLMSIFDCHLLEPPTMEDKERLLQMQPSLRSEVINLIKKWTNFHGLFIGRKTLKSIEEFLRRICDDQQNYPSLQPYAKSILSQLPSLSFGMKQGLLPDPEDKPIIPDPQIIFKPKLKLIEPDPLEVARQITLIFHTAFKAVHSREFVVALGEQRVSHQTPTLAEFFDFGERLTLLVLETIVLSSDPPGAILKVLEIAQTLESLGNYDALACVLRALHSEELNSAIFYPPTTNSRNTLIQLWSKCGDDPLTQEFYNSSVISRFSSWKPTIPNLKTEMISLSPVRSPSFINGLINWEKRRGITEKTAILYRFQNKAYSFWPIPQIQKMVKRGALLTKAQIFTKIDQFGR